MNLDRYLLENDEWKYDRIPEIIDGKNIADFIDIDLEQKLEALEREEAERLRQRPAYLEDSDVCIFAFLSTRFSLSESFLRNIVHICYCCYSLLQGRFARIES
jgi:hypothetical protein